MNTDEQLGDYEGPPRRPSFVRPPGRFGVLGAIAWSIGYFLVMQVVATFLFGIPIIVIAVVLMQQSGRPMPAETAGMMADDIMGPALIILLGCAHLTGLLFGWLMLRWHYGGRHWKRQVALTRGPTGTHWALILIGFPGMLAVSVTLEQMISKYVPTMTDILHRAGVNFDWPSIEQMMPLLANQWWPVALLTVAVLPALNEELWCRGFLAKGLSGRYRNWVVVLIASFIFGCLHMEPRQGLGAMALGAAMHGAYLATRSLWAPIFIHFLNNGLAAIHVNRGLQWPILQPLEDVFEHAPIAFTASGVCLLAAVGCALYQTRGRLVPTQLDLVMWEPDSTAGAELPPANSGVVVTHEPLSALSAGLVAVGAIVFAAVTAYVIV